MDDERETMLLFSHDLIVLVARSRWPFKFASRALFPLALFALLFSCCLLLFWYANGRWKWWSNPHRLNQHELKETKEKGRRDQRQWRKIAHERERESGRERLRASGACVHDGGTPSVALLCMFLWVFSPFLSLLHWMSFGLRCQPTTRTTQRNNTRVAQWLERAEKLSDSGRAKLFSSRFFLLHADLFVRHWHAATKANFRNT